MPNDVIPQSDQLPQLPWSQAIELCAQKLLTMEQTECKLTHLFEGSLYIREIRIPAETYFIGRIHKEGHVCQLLEGSLVLIHAPGVHECFSAPSEIVTLPGYQMALYTVTDCVARTLHPNPRQERDPVLLETQFFEPHPIKMLP